MRILLFSFRSFPLAFFLLLHISFPYLVNFFPYIVTFHAKVHALFLLLSVL